MKKLLSLIRKNWQWILAILAILALIFYIIYPKLQSIGLRKYTIDNSTISFYYPENWLEITGSDLKTQNDQAKYGFQKKDDKDANFVIRVDDMAGKTNFDAQGSIGGIKKTLEKAPGELKIDYIRVATFHNLSAVESEFDYSVTTNLFGGKLDMRQRQMIFLHNEKLYWLMFSSKPQDFNNNVKDFDKILKTFQIK